MTFPVTHVRLWLICLFCLGLATSAYANNDIFMSIVGPRGPIHGEASSPHGNQWIRVLEVDESLVSQSMSGKASGKLQHEPVKIVKQVDAASPELQKAAATGEHMKEVVFQFSRNNAGKEELYQTIRLSEVIITGVHNRGASSVHSDRPTEEISLQYEKIEITYALQRTEGVKSPPVKSSDTLRKK